MKRDILLVTGAKLIDFFSEDAQEIAQDLDRDIESVDNSRTIIKSLSVLDVNRGIEKHLSKWKSKDPFQFLMFKN